MAAAVAFAFAFVAQHGLDAAASPSTVATPRVLDVARDLGARAVAREGDRAIVAALAREKAAAPARVLVLRNLNTSESLELRLPAGDAEPATSPETDAKIRAFFRSHEGAEKPIDPRLLKLLAEVQRAFDGKPIVVVSGHRKPGRGTSSRSYHVRGMAADVAIEGVKPVDLRRAAIRLGARGAGLYPSFVHLDVRDTPYRWSGGGPSRKRTKRVARDIYAE